MNGEGVMMSNKEFDLNKTDNLTDYSPTNIERKRSLKHRLNDIDESLNLSPTSVKIRKKSRGPRSTLILINSTVDENPRYRLDYYGTEIKKENKRKVKVTFVDEVNKSNLVETVEFIKIKELVDSIDDKVREACCSCIVF